MKNFTLPFLLFLFVAIFHFGSYGQKDYWTAYFPGYLYYWHNANIGPDQSFNFSLNNEDTSKQNKFISLDNNGYVLFEENTNEIALLNFLDSSGNRYLISYSTPTLRMKKYDTQNSILFDNPLQIPNGVTVTPNQPANGVVRYSFINATKHLFTSNGDLIISGLFQVDTSFWGLYHESLTAYFFDTTSGNIINSYVRYNLDLPVTQTQLQEDNLGNINLIYYNEGTQPCYVDKISINGNLITSKEYGDYFGINNSKEFVKATENFIYILFDEFSSAYMLKLDKTLLDTIYYKNLNIVWSFGNFVDVGDSTFHINFSNFSNWGYQLYNHNGDLICNDLNNYISSGYKLIRTKNKAYSARSAFSEGDSLCNFSICSKNFDPITQQLIWGFTTLSPSYPDDHYIGDDVFYIVSRTQSNVLGVIGVIDSTPKNFGGKLYYDIAADCIADTTDPGIPNKLIQIDPQNHYVFTDPDGNYNNYLTTGNYTLSAVPFNNTLSLCPVAIPLNITNPSSLYGNNDIAVQDQAGNLQDLAVTLNQSPSVTGYLSHFYVTVINHQPLTASGYVKLTVDSIYSFATSNPAPDSISGNNFFWSATNINFLNNKNIYASFIVDSTVITGTFYSNTVEVINISGESNLSNNTDIFQGTVFSSYDPNDKHVVPHGIGSNGYIHPLDTILNYKIRFQNTGTYTAYHIKVIDTIDVSLDISTFNLLSTSHPCQLTSIDENVIQFKFDNIMLPDSNTNEPQSHGFINYSIQTKPGLPLQTQIRNKAYIYFDFNVPVVTNETVNTLDLLNVDEIENKLKILVFPNPTNNQVDISFTLELPKEIKIGLYNSLGQSVKTISKVKLPAGENKISLSVSNLAKGIYHLKFTAGDEVVVKRVVKM